jgi:hypothetical protein
MRIHSLHSCVDYSNPALPQIFAQPDRRLAQRAVHTGEAAIKMIERDSGLARSIRIGFQV